MGKDIIYIECLRCGVRFKATAISEDEECPICSAQTSHSGQTLYAIYEQQK